MSRYVTVPEHHFRVVGNQLIIQPIEEPGGAISATDAYYAVDFRVGKHSMNICYPLFVCSSEMTIPRPDVFSFPHIEPKFLHNLTSCCNRFLLVQWTGRRYQAHGISLLQRDSLYFLGRLPLRGKTR